MGIIVGISFIFCILIFIAVVSIPFYFILQREIIRCQGVIKEKINIPASLPVYMSEIETIPIAQPALYWVEINTKHGPGGMEVPEELYKKLHKKEIVWVYCKIKRFFYGVQLKSIEPATN